MSYEPTIWKKGDKVTSTKLNKIENGIQGNDEEITSIKEGLSDMNTATSADVGKALKAKTVTDGKVTEWEFGEAGASVELDATLTDATKAAQAKAAGDAINAVKEDLNAVAVDYNWTEAESLTWTPRKMLNSDGTLSDISNDNYYVSDFIAIPSGTIKIDIYGSAYKGRAIYVIYDSEDAKVASDTVSTEGVKHVVIDIPKNGAKLRISKIQSYYGVVKFAIGLSNDNIKARVDNLEKTIAQNFTELADDYAYTSVTLSWSEKKRIDSTGYIKGTNNDVDKVSDPIDITSAWGLLITASTRDASWRSWAFYDEAMVPISTDSGNAKTYTDEFAYIPDGAKYICISYNGSTPAGILKLITGVEKTDAQQYVTPTDLDSAITNTQKELANGYTGTEASEIVWNTGMMLYDTGGTVSVGDSNYCVTDFIDVPSGTKLIHIITRSEANYAPWVLYDANGTKVSSYKASSGTRYDAIIDVPSSATKLKVATIRSADAYVFFISEFTNGNIVNKLETLDKTLKGSIVNVAGSLEKTPLSLSWETGYYIYGDGYIKTTSSSYAVSEPIDVTDAWAFEISASAGDKSWGCWAFYDEADTVISVQSGEAKQHSGVIVSIPAGAKSLRVSWNKSVSESTVDKITGVSGGSKKWDGLKWVCFGDSLTEQNGRTNKWYYTYIAEKTGIVPYVMGDSGSGYIADQSTNAAFFQRIANVPTDADVITIFGSGNDCGSVASKLGTVTDTGTATICGCINTTLDTLFTNFPLANVGIVTPCPWVQYPPSDAGNAMEVYSAALVEICRLRGIPCLDLYHCSGLRPWEESYRNLCYTNDGGNGVHPDATGHAILASKFEAFLDTLLLH